VVINVLVSTDQKIYDWPIAVAYHKWGFPPHHFCFPPHLYVHDWFSSKRREENKKQINDSRSMWKLPIYYSKRVRIRFKMTNKWQTFIESWVGPRDDWVDWKVSHINDKPVLYLYYGSRCQLDIKVAVLTKSLFVEIAERIWYLSGVLRFLYPPTHIPEMRILWY
jgi:hypothetical protein